MIEKLKIQFGRKCSGINLNGRIATTNLPDKKMKFCEAVHYSFDVPLQITGQNINCQGALRSLGFRNNDSELSETISAKNHVPLPYVQHALRKIPVLTKKIEHVNLGITIEMESVITPDMYILFVNPVHVTRIMQSLAKHEITPFSADYAFLSICGNVFAYTYMNQQVSISFGCPESRLYGGVENNEVVVGIPHHLAHILVN